ncbi:hypothetical protein [Nonomuraea sp. NPDC052265]|uniref:hypothetical protein n=1 Tax=Nonomuraea sp. NPDC052265 TaxID=3364374 RepID=UPI0037C65AB9
MIRTPYRAKSGAAQLGAALPGQPGPFGIRPEPTPEPTSQDTAQEPLPPVEQHNRSRIRLQRGL